MLLQGICHSDAVHDSGQHTHGIAVGPLHFIRAILHAPPEVAAADDQTDLYTLFMALADDLTHWVDDTIIEPPVLIASQGFTAEL